ncbi:MAG: hypothetical protein MUF27_17310 [Acidobacteria bacterium]|jgi:hypothetical protein|nr:hypothetical protein [Acidobacteriota bacterium]
MIRPVRSILHGLTDPSQAAEAAALGLDAAVVALAGSGEPDLELDPSAAARVAAALPPLAVRAAQLGPCAALPPGFGMAVTPAAVLRPPGAAVHLVRLGWEEFQDGPLPAADGIWIRPRRGAGATATGFDWDRVGWAAGRIRLVLELPDGAEGVETAVRLGRPYAVAFARAVWFRPGIVDLDRLEAALAAVARLNHAAFRAGFS